MTPLANSLVAPERAAAMERFHPLRAAVYAERMIERLRLGPRTQAVEVASNGAPCPGA
jgi:hypothetical protein